MSIRALNWAFDQRGIHATSKLVLIALANHADDNGYAWPGIDGIAERWGMSPRTVSRHIHLLSVDEYIAVAPRYRSNGSQTSNAYQLSMTPLTDCHPPHDTAVIPPMTTVSPPEPTVEPSLETPTTIAQSLADALPNVMRAARNLSPPEIQLVPLYKSSWPAWLKLLAEEQELDEKTERIMLEWAAPFPETTLKDMADTVVLKWPEYKRKNKSIFATFRNWFKRSANDTYRYDAKRPASRPVNYDIALEAKIQEAGYHPASPEAAQMRREANNGI